MHAGASTKIFELALKLRNNRTLEEIELWQFLKAKPHGYKFRQQHPFGDYILDFYCHKAKLSIEIDGINHRTKAQTQIDQYRSEFIMQQGVFEMRYTNYEIQFELSRVCGEIINQLQKLKHKSSN